jgi:anti-anti-sigma regulatory factor/DNA-binding NarL/FixJ family response regulator
VSGPLRVLHVEDNPTDAKLIARHLRRCLPHVSVERVDDEASLRAAFEGGTWDAILSDWSMPGFSGLAALRLVKALGLDVPFIIVSGAIGEEAAVEAMREGAHDYVSKDALARLAAVIEREVAQAERRAELARWRKEAEENALRSRDEIIEQLQSSVDELSCPILEVWDEVLMMPIIGLVDSGRTVDMARRLLAEVTQSQASFVIIDVTGVEVVDASTADHLIKLMRKVEMVGARCVVTGVRAAVAETLVDIGVDFAHLTTLRNLKHGLREALRHARRGRDGLRDLDLGEVAPLRELW